MTDPSLAASIYVRRSRKDADGSDRNGRSLREQEDECRDLAKRHGLTVVRTYAEKEGTGASRYSGKARPEWESALADLETGDEFHTVIVWALDRADRRGAASVAALLDKHADGSRRVLGVDGTNTSEERDRLTTIIRGEQAREETERISARVKRTKRADRAEGRWLGGRPPYGLRAVEGRLDHDPETYPVARRIAEAALAGETVRGIVRALNADGLTGPKGGPWAVATVAKMLRSPAFAGLQSHGRRAADGRYPSVAEEYRDADGLAVSVGRGVVTPSERSLLFARLDARTVDRDRNRRGGRRRALSLLAGMIRCECCDVFGVMGSGSYRCSSVAKGATCARPFTAPVAAVDATVEILFLRRLAALDPGDPLVVEIAARWVRSQGDDEDAERVRSAAAQVEALDADLARARRLAVSGVLTEEEAAEEVPRLRHLLARARADAASIPASIDVTPLLDVMASAEAWAGLDVFERRDYLALAIRRVRVERAPRRGCQFVASERVAIEWADGTTSTPTFA